MRKLGLLAVIVSLCLGYSVSTARAEIKISGDVYAGMYNKYIFRGVDLSDNKWVSQFGADLSYKGLTLSYWSNLLTADGTILGSRFESGDLSETDITLNYTYTPIELLTFNVGNTFYSLENFEDTNELYLKTTVNTLLSPTFAIYWDWDQSKETGLFYTRDHRVSRIAGTAGRRSHPPFPGGSGTQQISRPPGRTGRAAHQGTGSSQRATAV